MADDIEFKALLDTGDFDAGMAVLTGGLMHIGSLAVDAFLAAGAAVADFAGESFQGAVEAESAMAGIEQTIRSTGGAAGLTAEEVQALADKFTVLAGGSDDVVLAIEQVALRAGTISEDEMPAFIQAALDLGEVMKDDAGAALLLARAQDDPIAAFKKIEKSTGAYDSALEDQIKTLQDAGDSAGAVDLIMGHLAKTTSGAAAAGLDTAAGRAELFKNTLNEAGEAAMAAFLPALSTIFDTVIKPNLPLITDLGNAVAGLVTSFLAVNDPITVAKDALAVLGVTFAPIIDAAMNLGSAFMDSMPQIIGAAQMISDFLVGLFGTLGPTLIANVSSFLNSMAAFWDAHGTTIIATVTLAFNLIATVVAVTLNQISGGVAAFGALLNGDVAGFLGTVQSTFAASMNAILSLVGSDLESFTASWAGTLGLVGTLIGAFVAMALSKINEFIGNWQGVFDLAGQIVDAFSDRVSSAWNSVVGAIEGAVNAARGVIQSFADAIASVSLPWWLTPGSPTPLETGLWGITDALQAVTNSLPSSVGGVGQSMSTVNNMTNSPQFNLSVNTQETSQSVIGNFAVMQSLAGA